MPALCGPLGPMVCLNGATCNATTGLCENCPLGCRNDEILFLGNQNCGMNDVVIQVLYILNASFSFLVAIYAIYSALYFTASRNVRVLLALIAVWTGLIPFYNLAHYMAGYKHGFAAAILLPVILCLANTMVYWFFLGMEAFIDMICENGRNIAKLRKLHFYWYVFWMVNKIVYGIVLIAGLATNQASVFNAGQETLAISLLVEVTSNIYRGYQIHAKLRRGVEGLKETSHINRTHALVIEFAKRIQLAYYSYPIYGALFAVLGVAWGCLYIVYQSSIPYAFVLWTFIVLTWPLVAMCPLIVLRTQLGRLVESGKMTQTLSVDATLEYQRGVSPLPASQLFVETTLKNFEPVKDIYQQNQKDVD